MIELVQYDTLPPLSFRIKQGNAVAPLPVGTTAVFKIKKPSGALTTITLSQTDAAKQIWSGAPGLNDLDETGEMLGELVVTVPGGAVQHGEDPIPVFVRAAFQEGPR